MACSTIDDLTDGGMTQKPAQNLHMAMPLWFVVCLVAVFMMGCAQRGGVEHYRTVNDQLLSYHAMDSRTWQQIDWANGSVQPVQRRREAAPTIAGQPARAIFPAPELWRFESIGSMNIYWADQPGPLVLWLAGEPLDDLPWLPVWLNQQGVHVMDASTLLGELAVRPATAAVQLNGWLDVISRTDPERVRALGLIAHEPYGNIALEAAARSPQWHMVSVVGTPLMPPVQAEMLRAETDGVDVERWQPFWARCLSAPDTSECRRPPQSIKDTAETVPSAPRSLTGAWATYDFTHRLETYEFSWANWAKQRDWTHDPRVPFSYLATPQFWFVTPDVTANETEKALQAQQLRGAAIAWATSTPWTADLSAVGQWLPALTAWSAWWQEQVTAHAYPWDARN